MKRLATPALFAVLAVAAAIPLTAPALAHGPQGGMGYGMGPGMMGGMGMHNPGMMGGPGVGGPGMMGMGQGMTGCPFQQQAAAPLTADTVRSRLEQHLQFMGNPRLQLGEVTERDGSIVADIVTKEGGTLVDRLAFDIQTGAMRRLD